MRRPPCIAVALGALALAAGLSACGDAGGAPEPRPAGTADYSRLTDAGREAAARGCRDDVAAQSSGLAARQIARVDPALLRAELDRAAQADGGAVPFRSACADALPLVTPGLRVTFAAATGNGRTFAYPTRSDRPLTIRGAIAPAPAAGRVTARRLVGRPQPLTAAIDAHGRFAFRDLKLRKMADNSFLLSIDAPPNAPRVVRFSALCLDCGAGAATPPPS